MNWALLGAEFARVLDDPWAVAVLAGMAAWGFVWIWLDRDVDWGKDGGQ